MNITIEMYRSKRSPKIERNTRMLKKIESY